MSRCFLSLTYFCLCCFQRRQYIHTHIADGTFTIHIHWQFFYLSHNVHEGLVKWWRIGFYLHFASSNLLSFDTWWIIIHSNFPPVMVFTLDHFRDQVNRWIPNRIDQPHKILHDPWRHYREVIIGKLDSLMWPTSRSQDAL